MDGGSHDAAAPARPARAAGAAPAAARLKSAPAPSAPLTCPVPRRGRGSDFLARAARVRGALGVWFDLAPAPLQYVLGQQVFHVGVLAVAEQPIADVQLALQAR